MLHGMARWISAFGLRNSENKCVLFACRMFKPYVLCAHYTYLHSACICVCELRCGNDCDWASRIWLLFLRWNNHFTNWQSARLFLHMLFCVCLSEYSFFFFDSFILILSAQMLAKISACILVTSIFSCIFFSLSLSLVHEKHNIPFRRYSARQHMVNSKQNDLLLVMHLLFVLPRWRIFFYCYFSALHYAFLSRCHFVWANFIRQTFRLEKQTKPEKKEERIRSKVSILCLCLTDALFIIFICENEIQPKQKI